MKLWLIHNVGSLFPYHHLWNETAQASSKSSL